MLRGYADNIGFPVHGAEIETGLLGFLLTKWFQQNVYPVWPEPFQWTFVIVHASWFAVPWIAALLVSWRRPERIGSFFRWWIALHAGVVIAFSLFPLEPPWMANAEVMRIVPSTIGVDANDTNPLAAMPSLHVALPLLLSLWFFCEGWKRPGFLMLGYSAIVGLEVVFSGEHYVMDLVGAGVAALAVALAARIDVGRLLSGIKRSLEKKAGAGRTAQPWPVPVPIRQTEKGQTLIEFAFVFPMLFILILVIIDFGFALDRREVIQHGVREGARTAAVGADIPTIEGHTNNESGGVLNSVTICYVDGSDGNTYPGNAGDSVRVIGNYKHKLMIGGGAILGGVLPDIDMSPTATARLEKTVLGAGACP